ncbi:MAG: HAMP domain-containing sensor histidine kinase [Sedimentibacter sp.]
MKLSIKYRLPIVIILVFVFYMISLVVYYRFFIFSNAVQNFNVFREELDEVGDEISIGIEERYPDMEYMNSFIHSMSKEKNIKIKVYDTEGNNIFAADHSDNKNMAFRVKDFVSINGKVVYILEIEYSFLLKKFLFFDYSGKLIIFSLISLCMMVLFLIFYLHHSVVSPLLVLQDSFETVNYRSNKVGVITKRNDEIGELYKKFEEMVKKLELSHRQQIDMISSISHDLKTPLTSIIGYVERLSDDKVKSEQKKLEYYDIIYRKAHDIECLIEEFSTYAKNEYSCGSLQKHNIKVIDFFNSICEEYSNELEAYDVDFVCQPDTIQDVSMEVDVNQLRRVFANLVSNSLKYVKHPVKIFMSYKIEKNFVRFSVEDNGGGVPEEELSQIFNNFYRVDKSRSRDKGGSGLGLSICRTIIESHQGRVWAYNIDQKGFGIAFVLPLNI